MTCCPTESSSNRCPKDIQPEGEDKDTNCVLQNDSLVITQSIGQAISISNPSLPPVACPPVTSSESASHFFIQGFYNIPALSSRSYYWFSEDYKVLMLGL